MSTTDAPSESPQQPAADDAPSFRRSGRRFGDSTFAGLSTGAGVLIFVTLALVALFLTLESWPAITQSQEWLGVEDGQHSLVGVSLPLVFGTVFAAVIALSIAVPVALGVALFISHYAPRRLSSGLGYMIDLLAAVPSVVYGLWGGLWLVPRIEPVYRLLNETLGSWPRWPDWIPFEVVRWPEWFPYYEWGGRPVFTVAGGGSDPQAINTWDGDPIFGLFSGDPTAPMRNLASAAIVLAVMVLPIITSVSREVFLQTPRSQEEAALALGATRWEVIRTVVLPFGRNGVVAASMLGLGRALGETMAVLMILGVGTTFTTQILEVGRHSTIAQNIASNQAEASGVEMSLLIFTGLVLFALTFVINSLARWIVARSSIKS